MPKSIAEQSNALKISWLKKRQCLPLNGGTNWGTITWTCGASKNSVSYNIHINTKNNTDDPSYIKLNYTQTNRWTNEKNDMDFKILLTTTPCYYGGVRYWFVCPLIKNGHYCGRRVGVLYNIGKYFGCRHCGRIAYEAQFEGGKLRAGSVYEPDVEKAYNEVKIKYYCGKPTRRYKRYLRLRQKMDNSWRIMGMRFGMKF